MTHDFDNILLNSRDAIDRLISLTSQCGDHWHRPLFRAARDGLIGIAAPTSPNCDLKPKQLARFRKPMVVLLQEDDGSAVGPSGWKCALKMRWWAASAIVHAAGGLPEHYEIAMDAALASGRLLLVDTDTAHGQEWADFIMQRQPPISCLHISVRPGEPAHPKAQVLQ